MKRDRESIRILIGEGLTLFRLGIIKLLKEDDGLYLVGEAENGEELIGKYFDLKPDLVLVDISLPILSGLIAISKIKEKDKNVKALFLTNHNGNECITNVIKAGGSGLINKNDTQDELIFAIKKIYYGELYFGPSLDREQLEEIIEQHKKVKQIKTNNVILTSREQEILYLLSEAISSSEIAARLGVRKRTIDTHRTNLMQKLNITTLPKLIKFAVDFVYDLDVV